MSKVLMSQGLWSVHLNLTLLSALVNSKTPVSVHWAFFLTTPTPKQLHNVEILG